MIHLSILFTFFTACELESAFLPESEINSPSFENVPIELQDFFSEFEREAKLRGIYIDLNHLGITAEFRSIDELNVIGSCTTNG